MTDNVMKITENTDIIKDVYHRLCILCNKTEKLDKKTNERLETGAKCTSKTPRLSQ